MTLVSGLIMTRNEEQFITECIYHHKPYLDEIIVLDNSTDRTAEIAELLGATVHKSDNPYPSERRNIMQDLSRNDWCLHIDADELFDKLFLEQLPMIIEQYSDKSIAYLPRFNLPFGTRYPDVQPRLVKKSRIVWTRKLHEIPTIEGSTKPFDSLGFDEVLRFTYPIIIHRVTDRDPRDRISRLREWKAILLSNKEEFEDWDFEVKHLEDEIRKCKELRSY